MRNEGFGDSILLGQSRESFLLFQSLAVIDTIDEIPLK
jgi:hypothetical protein